jgi:hypothetical protein
LTRLGELKPEAADARQFFDRVFKDHLRRWEGGEGPSLGEEGQGCWGKGLASAEEVKEMKSWGKTWNAASRLR